jgi:hypothetical protein
LFTKWGFEHKESKFFFPSGVEGRKGACARPGTERGKKKLSFLSVKSPIFENDSSEILSSVVPSEQPFLAQKKNNMFFSP